MQPIESYNINNKTYVIAEDLFSYGFDVKWDPKARTLKIACNYQAAEATLKVEQININKKDIVTGKILYDVYRTNIKTFIDDKIVTAYNIDGYTLIKLSDLSVYGNLSWSENRKLASINVLPKVLNEAFEKAEKQEIKIDEFTTYIGEVKDGVPNGIGKEKYLKEWTGKAEYGFGHIGTFDYYIKDEFLGYYVNGIRNGRGIINHIDASYGRRMGNNGYSIIPIYSYSEVNYDNGKLGGFFVLESVSMGSERREGYYNNNGSEYQVRISNFTGAGGETDKYSENSPQDYKFGFRVTTSQDTSRVDMPYDFISSGYNYKDESAAVKEDGTLWMFGKLSRTPLFITDNVKEAFPTENFGAGDYYVLKNSGELYYYWNLSNAANTMGEGSNWFPKGKKTAENVETICGLLYIDKSGNVHHIDYHYEIGISNAQKVFAYQTSTERIQGLGALTKSGELYLWQMNNACQIGENYPDFLDKPVVVMQNVKDASLGNVYAAIKNDGTLWTWGAEAKYLGIGDKEIEGGTVNLKGIEYPKEPQFVAENVKMVESGNNFVTILKNDGSVWTFGENNEGQLGNGTFTASNVPVKIMDNVKFIGKGYAIKEDGTLWGWGNNDRFRLGTSDEKYIANQPIQINGALQPYN